MKPEDIPIVVISLDRRPDRWANFMKKAAAANIDPERFVRLSAVDASTFDTVHHPAVSVLTAHNIKNNVRRAHYEIDRAGAVGASLSHFKAWNYLQQSPTQSNALIVLEDDGNIPTDFDERLEALLADLPSAGAWDVISFYNTPYAGGVQGCKPTTQAPWSNCQSLMGAHAYMVSRQGAQRLLEKAYPIELHVDAYLAFMSRLNYIQMLWHPAMQVTQNFDESDIHHGEPGILNVPTNIEKHGLVVLDPTSVIGIVLMAAVAGGILSLVFVARARP
jgi:GR25 family glycosyltransferase involved in LPS biosynthesis